MPNVQGTLSFTIAAPPPAPGSPFLVFHRGAPLVVAPGAQVDVAVEVDDGTGRRVTPTTGTLVAWWTTPTVVEAHTSLGPAVVRLIVPPGVAPQSLALSVELRNWQG